MNVCNNCGDNNLITIKKYHHCYGFLEIENFTNAILYYIIVYMFLFLLHVVEWTKTQAFMHAFYHLSE